jgi:hypothetical protein
MMGYEQSMRRFFCAAILCLITAFAYAADSEDVFWQSVVKGNVQEEYELYLNQYPKGRYVKEARRIIDGIREEAARREKEQQKRIEDARKRRDEEEEQRRAEERRRQQEDQARREDERRVAEEARKRQEEERRRERQVRLRQHLDYVSVTIGDAVRTNDGRLLVHLDFANHDTGNANAAFAFFAQYSDGIADFWKFFPQAEANAFDQCGNSYQLSEASGLGFARTNEDWTVVGPGQSTTATLVFRSGGQRERCSAVGVSVGLRIIVMRGGQAAVQARAFRFNDILD